MEAGSHQSLDQSGRNFTMPGQNTSNGCCRLCFKGNCHLQELFPGGYTEELLISKIFECTTVEITFANDPDALICYSCVAKIEEFHRYREQCRSNDAHHKNSKRCSGGKMLTVPTSALIPAKYVKKEIDSEGFEISPAEFYPLEAADQSYGGLESAVEGPTARVADSSGAVDSTFLSEEDGVRHSEQDEKDDENLLELMPEQTHNEFSVPYTDMNEKYENNNEVFCEVPIKEEPQDIDDDADEWNDFGMEDDGTMDRSTNLIPLIDNRSYSTDFEDDAEQQQPFREVYKGADLFCLMHDGFLYLRASKLQWRCRRNSCGAAVFKIEYSKELETNGVNHAHRREVENSATDMEILRLLEDGSPPPPHESDDESFHYVQNVRKGSSIIYKGYKYSMKHKNVDGTTYWKCRSYGGTCMAALYQTLDNKFKTVGNHTHAKQDLDTLMNKTRKPNVSRVGAQEEKSPPGKLKLRIAGKSDATNSLMSKSTATDGEKKQIPINQRDAQGVVRRGYGYKIVKNHNGRPRLRFDGHLYVQESSKKEDGVSVVVWRCRRNYDMCRVAALQYEDGLVEVIGDHDHAPIKSTLSVLENSVGTTAYYLLPTFKGGEALILDGYRYVKACNKMNGESLWRCTGSAGISCRVKLILAKDGVAYVLKNFKHDHAKPKKSRTTLPNANEASKPIKRKDGNGDDGVGKKPFRTGVEPNNSTQCAKPMDNIANGATSSASDQTAKVSSKKQPMRNFRVIRNKKGNEALVYGGYRYCKVRTRQDGIISWFCRMNKKTCRVGLYQYPDGRIERINQSNHNHGPTDPQEPAKKIVPEKKPKIIAESSAKKATYHMDDETFVSNEWYYVRNRKNGTTLIHAGYRYHKKGMRVDSTSMWRCSRASRGCRAAIVMHSDETIAKFDDIDHDHAPPGTIMDEETIVSGDPDARIEQSPDASMESNDNEPELSLVNYNGCIDEPDDHEANMRSILSTMLDVSDEPNGTVPEKVVLSPSKAHYRYVKNRRHTKSLVFRGYRYARSSMAIRTDGSVKWVCQMNKKTCRVSVKVLSDGSLEMDGNKHNHPQLPEDIEGKYDYADDDEDDDADVSIRDATFDNDSTIHQADELDKDDAHEYYFALNRCNGTSLIFQHNRYSKESTRPDGSTIWRCMVRSDCASKVLLQADGSCVVFRNPDHHHPPLEELPKPIQHPVNFPSGAAKLAVKGDMLIYKQNRMKKVKSFSNGTALFKCVEVDGCTAIVKLQYEETDDGKPASKVISESAHNHDSFLADTAVTGTGPRADGKNKGKSPIKTKRPSTSDSDSDSDSEESGTGNEYQLFKNDRGHVFLVYKDYRFSLRNRIANGNTSWKCRANKTCNAHVTFSKNGYVVPMADGVKVMPHNHPVNGECIERSVPLELDELHPRPKNLSQFVSSWVKGIYRSQLGGKMKASHKPSASGNDGKKTIQHKNYSYKLQTIKNGREFWRCTMFKARACRAGLFCSGGGTVIQYENGRAHNHDPIKKSATANSPRKSHHSHRGKIHGQEASDALYEANEAFATVNDAGITVKRSHSSMQYEDQPVEERSLSTPAYQIVKKDGVDVLHYEKHRYVKNGRDREAATAIGEPKRWRCCLWNSRHQCPVELTVLDSGEIQFETDLTHSHRPPPPESQDVERLPAVNTKGTRKYEVIGRAAKTVFYKGYKFLLKEQLNDWMYYACVCSDSHECRVTVKVDPNGILHECSSESHNHLPPVLNDPASLKRIKPLSERAIASREARLAKCRQTGSDEYRFVRSCVGNSMVFEGHRYWLHSKLSCGLYVYRCRYQKAKACPGSVYMDMDTELMYHRYDAEHNHKPLPEDALAGGENPTSSVSSSEKLNSSITQDEQSIDNFDEFEPPASEIKVEVPKEDGQREDGQITTNYTFVKNYLNKNQLLYDNYVYEFVPLSYRSDSEKFYSCIFAECSAAVKLLASGNLKVMEPNQHTHERPDLTDCRDVGRGSADFTTLSPGDAGTKTKLLFEGYTYCANVSQQFQDCTKVFYCYSSVLAKEKTKSSERCAASLELLPNNRVIVKGTHHHPAPKLADRDASEQGDTKVTKVIVVEGRSYRYLSKHPDGTVVWQCTDDPRCKAKVYGKPDGELVYGNTKHVPRHQMPKLANRLSTEMKPSLPASDVAIPAAPTGSFPPTPTSSNAIVPSSTGSLRTKWYQGNRYNFYLTRRDGVQYWRCSKRIEENCETGILCYPTGLIMPYNSMQHTHPALNPTAEQLPGRLELKTVQKLVDPNDGVDGKVSKYSMLHTDTSNDLFVTYRGVKYSLRKRNPDGVRVYRCRNKPCTHTLFVTKRGKIISKKTTWHSCEKRPEADARALAVTAAATANAFSSSTSGLGFDRPEIEDPDDLVDQNDSIPMEPASKRIRLGFEMVVEQTSGPKPIVQTEDSVHATADAEVDDVDELIEECHEEMQDGVDAGDAASDTWEQEYLEQESESPDAIVNETAADSETDDRRPIDDEVGDDTNDKLTIEELGTPEHSRESFTLKASFNEGQP